MTTHPLTVDELERWRLFGSHWRIVEISVAGAEVELCTCTGEPVERRRTAEPVVLDYLRSTREPGCQAAASGR